MKVAVYISNLNKIGGVETFAINLCNRTGFDLIFKDYDINQLKKLKHNFYSINYNSDLEYDVIILAQANWAPYPTRIKAKYFIQTIHADYKEYERLNFVYRKFNNTTHHIAVSEHVAKMFEEVTPYKIDKVIYNLLPDTEVPKVEKHKKLSFITLSRFSKEKGYERVLKMAEKLKGEDYIWNIYGDNNSNYAKEMIRLLEEYPNIRYRGVTTNAKEEIAKHSYLVQLSDTEGFCYSMYESLSVLTPVIVTNFNSAYEMVVDGVNGYIFDMDLSDFCVNKIKSIPLIKSFKEKSTEKDWFDFINEITKN